MLVTSVALLGGCRASQDRVSGNADGPGRDATAWAGVHFACADGGDGSPALLVANPPQLMPIGVEPGLAPMSWSADGEWLALEGETQDGKRAIWALDRPGGDPARLTPDEALSDEPHRLLAWSPRGHAVLLVDAESRVWTWDPTLDSLPMAVGDVAPERLKVRYDEPPVAWSPDGRHVAWITPERKLQVRPHMWDSSMPVLPVPADRFVWSPTSNALLTYWEHENTFSEGTRYGVLSVLTGQWTELMDAPEARSLGPGCAATWSPDGSRLAINLAAGSPRYMSEPGPYLPTKRNEIVIFGADGAEQRVVEVAASTHMYEWATDSRAMLVWSHPHLLRHVVDDPTAEPEIVFGDENTRVRQTHGAHVSGDTDGEMWVVDMTTGDVLRDLGELEGQDAFDWRHVRAYPALQGGRRLVRLRSGTDDPQGGYGLHHEFGIWDYGTGVARRIDVSALRGDLEGDLLRPPRMTWSQDGTCLLATQALARDEDGLRGPYRAATVDATSGELTRVLGETDGWVVGPPVTRPGG